MEKRFFKRGEFKPWSMVMVALIAATTIAIVGMLSAPPSLQYALSKVSSSGYVVLASGEYTTIINNQANMLLDMGDVRGRAYPWNASTTLTITSNATPNVFGADTLLIPKNTFNFGDSPNMIKASTLIEGASDTDIYIIELDQSSDGIHFTPIGSVRFTGATTYETTFAAARAVNNDVYGIYGKIKCATTGPQTLNVAFTVYRFLETSVIVPSSGGANFPFN